MKTELIHGKQVFVVEHHHHVLNAWNKIRAVIGSAPVLLTLDHHSDTFPAFSSVIHKKLHTTTQPNLHVRSSKLCDEFGVRDGSVPQAAIELLKHDEHIDAAVNANLIQYAFVITFQNGWPARRKTSPSYIEWLTFLDDTDGKGQLDKCPFSLYDVPENKIFEVFPSDCDREHYDAVLESDFLELKLGEIRDMSAIVGIADILDTAFILDIDLDYFHTEKSIDPHDSALFYHLIRSAAAITIATEPGCVLSKRMSGETITSEMLLPRLLTHIETALGH